MALGLRRTISLLRAGAGGVHDGGTPRRRGAAAGVQGLAVQGQYFLDAFSALIPTRARSGRRRRKNKPGPAGVEREVGADAHESLPFRATVCTYARAPCICQQYVQRHHTGPNARAVAATTACRACGTTDCPPRSDATHECSRGPAAAIDSVARTPGRSARPRRRRVRSRAGAQGVACVPRRDVPAAARRDRNDRGRDDRDEDVVDVVADERDLPEQ